MHNPVPAKLPSSRSIKERPETAAPSASLMPRSWMDGGMTALNWPCVIFSQRPDFSLQFASPNIKELTGLTAADWCSHRDRFWEVVHESDAADLRQQIKRAAQSNSPVTNTYRIRHALTGRVAYILEHRQPIANPPGLLLGY